MDVQSVLDDPQDDIAALPRRVTASKLNKKRDPRNKDKTDSQPSLLLLLPFEYFCCKYYARILIDFGVVLGWFYQPENGSIFGQAKRVFALKINLKGSVYY